MTGPIIPADQWPEDAALHTWDEENGQGYWTVYDKVGGFWTIRSSEIPMPDGWDWHVPVMRHQTAPAIDLEKIVPAEKRLPDLFMVEYHENKGWNACRAELLARIDEQKGIQP